MIGIYKITNPEDKIYIGYTTNLYKRINYYKINKGIKQTKLYNSIIQYNWEQHKIELIEECTKDELRNKEQYWINYYNSWNDGLNSNPGGGGIITHTDETKQLISRMGQANKGKRIISHWKGKSRGEEFARNMSLSRTGKPNPKNAKPILQYDLKNNFIKEWSSIKEANLYLGKDKDSSAISECCRKKRQNAYKFKWKYKYENIS
jgi:group I intron endonuclease